MINKYSLVYKESGGLNRRWTPGMGAQAPVIDDLSWKSLKRFSDVLYDQGSRLKSNWIPDSVFQIPVEYLSWRSGVIKPYESTYDPGYRLKSSGHLYATPVFQPDQYAWQVVKRFSEVNYNQGERVRNLGYLYAATIIQPDNMAWQTIRRFSETNFLPGEKSKGIGYLFAAQFIPPDYLPWQKIRRFSEVSFLEGLKKWPTGSIFAFQVPPPSPTVGTNESIYFRNHIGGDFGPVGGDFTYDAVLPKVDQFLISTTQSTVIATSSINVSSPLFVFKNSRMLRLDSEYTVSGTTVTFVTNLVSGDIVYLMYTH